MLDELVSELLDLTATEKGYGNALYAASDEGPGCSGGCCTIGCCIELCFHLCW